MVAIADVGFNDTLSSFSIHDAVFSSDIVRRVPIMVLNN